MSIVKYEIINPITDRKKPHFNSRGFFVVPNSPIKGYRYYIECARYNPKEFTKEYYILIGVSKFDSQCRKCRVDDYNRLLIPIKGEIKDFIITECALKGNVCFSYIESERGYDVYKID